MSRRYGGRRPAAADKKDVSEKVQQRTRTKSARELALETLERVADTGAYSNLQLRHELQRSQLSRQDAALATELVYGTLQRQATLDYWLGQFVAKGIQKLSPWVLQLLRLSSYQLLFLDRIPDHAIVNEAVNIASRRGHAGIKSMVNGVLRNMIRRKDELTIEKIVLKDKHEQLAIRHSYPIWLIQRWVKRYGYEAAEALCAAGNESPSASLRINQRKQSAEEALAELSTLGMEATRTSVAASGVLVAAGGNLIETEGFREGRWTLQDESSMLVAEVLAPIPGMRVLDCCAAPGGKTGHLGELMDDQGELWASDIHLHKLQLIEAQATRLGLNSVQLLSEDAALLNQRFDKQSFDAVLLDAPCSGLGVIKRKPELKWTKSEDDIRSISLLQKQLIASVSELVCSGGTLVYSTCTIAEEENEQIIERFLADHTDFELDAAWSPRLLDALKATGAVDDSFKGMAQLLPQHFGGDGFFIARLKRVR